MKTLQSWETAFPADQLASFSARARVRAHTDTHARTHVRMQALGKVP